MTAVSGRASGGGAAEVGAVGVSGEVDIVVFTDRDDAAAGPVPVAVSVTLWSLPSQGTAMLPVPVVGKPAAAGAAGRRPRSSRPDAFCVTHAAATSAVLPPGHVTSSSMWNRVTSGAPTGGGEFVVLTCRDTDARPPAPPATRATSCSFPSQGTATLPVPLTG